MFSSRSKPPFIGCYLIMPSMPISPSKGISFLSSMTDCFEFTFDKATTKFKAPFQYRGNSASLSSEAGQIDQSEASITQAGGFPRRIAYCTPSSDGPCLGTDCLVFLIN